jgi:hypothetical protein
MENEKFHKLENLDNPICGFNFCYNNEIKNYDKPISNMVELVEIINTLFKDLLRSQWSTKLILLYYDSENDPVEINETNFCQILNLHKKMHQNQKLKIYIQENFKFSSIFRTNADYNLEQSKIVESIELNKDSKINSVESKKIEELKNEINLVKEILNKNQQDTANTLQEMINQMEQRFLKILVESKKLDQEPKSQETQIKINSQEEMQENDIEELEEKEVYSPPEEMIKLNDRKISCGICSTGEAQLKCIICTEFNLCSSCFVNKFHNFHPLITIHNIPHFSPENISMTAFSSSDFKSYHDQMYLNNNKKFFSSRGSLMNIQITHEKKNCVKLSAKCNETLYLPLEILNSSKIKFDEFELLITSKNSNQVKVHNYLVKEKIKRKERLDIKLEITTPFAPGTYEFSIIALHMSRKIECESLRVIIDIKGVDLSKSQINYENEISELLKENPKMKELFNKEQLEFFLFIKKEKGVSVNEFIKIMFENFNNIDLVLNKLFS